VNATTIDPNLSIISLNDLQGNPIATRMRPAAS
jgi:hypothetical protein